VQRDFTISQRRLRRCRLHSREEPARRMQRARTMTMSARRLTLGPAATLSATRARAAILRRAFHPGELRFWERASAFIRCAEPGPDPGSGSANLHRFSGKRESRKETREKRVISQIFSAQRSEEERQQSLGITINIHRAKSVVRRHDEFCIPREANVTPPDAPCL